MTETTDPLDEMLAALRAGAEPWVVPDAVGEQYKDELREDFRDNAPHWAPVRPKLLRMANHSGSIAGLIGQAADPTSSPRTLTRDEVFLGAAIVKEGRACHEIVEGRFCQKAKFGSLQAALDLVYGAGKVEVKRP